jgi:hypothetical protein
MTWLFRPSVLVVVSLALVIGALALVLPALWEEGKGSPPAPLPVADNEQEIVWLYSATSAATWERFVTAVGKSVKRLQTEHPKLDAHIDDAFPRQTAIVPQLSLTLNNDGRRLVFRWYKLTSDGKTAQWVEALLRRRPAPLAIIGGSSSDLAIELVTSLRDQAVKHPDVVPPLVLLTSATADRIRDRDLTEDVPLNSILDKRTFRFCFTNRQMAQSVTDFIWKRDELRPDADPFYVAMWRDDPYSLDLTGRFSEVLRQPLAALSAARVWGLVTGFTATGILPLDLHGQYTEPVAEYVDFSVGLSDQPNRWEAPVVRQLIETKTLRYPAQQKPLLVLTAGSSQAARRFLRGLFREDTKDARRFVVATGDGLSFNTVYRDRNLTWPFQDVPFNLVFFCHRDPVDKDAGFQAEGEVQPLPPDQGSPTTGTEDLLLNMDIVEALVLACYESWPANADDLAAHLGRARWIDDRIAFGTEGVPLFDAQGNRAGGTGEHLVWLRPVRPRKHGEPPAFIEVWVPGQEEAYRILPVNYDDMESDR